MRCVQHKSNNGVLGAPTGMSYEECAPAPITRVVYADGTSGVRTYWTPTAAELELLRCGGYIEVEVIGNTMPPIAVKAAP